MAEEDYMETGLGPSQVKENDILHSDSTSYQILNFNGEGCFGKIAKCRNLGTGNIEAVKILKFDLIECEVEMLEALRTLDPDKTNIVRFMESFQFQNLSCLVFEMLDRSLLDLIKERNGNPLDLKEIRPVTHQLLVALDALKGLSIIHADLKPDNVMLVNHRDQPFKIKLIDFGLALPEKAVEPGMFIQTCAYRAPEVALGLPLSTAADTWSVGCIMAYMHLGRNLFPNSCEYNWMKVMLHLLGQPDHLQLGSGIHTSDYFTREDDSKDPQWRFNTPEEYEEATGIKPNMKCKFSWLVKDLEDALHIFTSNGDPTELKDREAFLSLLKRCLHMNSEGRITPREAMTHSFITMVHLVEEKETSVYADAAFQLMTISPPPLNESEDNRIDTEPITKDNGGIKDQEDPRTDSAKPPADGSQDENNECDHDKLDLSDIVISVGIDHGDAETSTWAESRLEESTDLMPHTIYFNEEDTDPESPHSGHREPSTDMSSKENSERPSAATDLQDGLRNTAPLSEEESSIAATSSKDDTNTDCWSISNNTCDHRASVDVDPTDGEAPSISKDGVSSATTPTDDVNTDPEDVEMNTGPEGADINSGPERVQKETLFRRACKFFGRVRKRVLSTFVCGKIESDN